MKGVSISELMYFQCYFLTFSWTFESICNRNDLIASLAGAFLVFLNGGSTKWGLYIKIDLFSIGW